MEKIEEQDSTENVFNYLVENAGPIFEHAKVTFKKTGENLNVTLDTDTTNGLCTHLSLLCQMVIVAVAERVHVGKDPNKALDVLTQFINSYIPDTEQESKEDQKADELIGLLFDKAGKA